MEGMISDLVGIMNAESLYVTWTFWCCCCCWWWCWWMMMVMMMQMMSIAAVVPVLLEALQDPTGKTVIALRKLLDTKFVHFIDAPSLALIMPVVQRAFSDRAADTRKMAAQIVRNMYSLTDEKARHCNVISLLLISLIHCSVTLSVCLPIFCVIILITVFICTCFLILFLNCYSAIRLSSRKCEIKLRVSVSVNVLTNPAWPWWSP